MRIGGLFEGYGGLTAGVRSVLGGDLAWYSEIDSAASRVLTHHHPDVPNLGDITAVDWTAVEPVDVLTGGFPCQDISNAGKKEGITGARSGLWSHYADAIRVLRPRYVVIENVGALIVRGLDRVLTDLAALGFDAEWTTVRASDVGTPHRRERVFIVAADATGERHGDTRTSSVGGVPAAAVASAQRAVAADTLGDAVREQPIAERWRSSASGPGWDHSAASDSDRGRLAGNPKRDLWPEDGQQAPLRDDTDGHLLEWGDFEPAIRRWERIIGRRAAAPTVVGARGARVLNPAFVEFMMGLPEGHVTGVEGLSRNDMLKILGNGVVPQQAAAAVELLLPLLTSAREVAA